MSIDALKWAWGQEIAHPGKKFVLVSLADFADGDGGCFPGQKKLAKMTGQSDRSVRRYLKVLEDEGYIKREPRFRPNGSKTSDSYQIVWNNTPPDSQSGGLTVRTPRTSSVRTPPDPQSAPPGQALSAPEPSINPQIEPSIEPSEIVPKKKGTQALKAATLFDLYNQEKPPAWETAIALNKKRKGALQSLISEHGEQTFEIFRAALVFARADDWWGLKNMTLDTLLVKGRVLEFAEKSQSPQITHGLSDADMRVAKTAHDIYSAIGGFDDD